MLTSTVSVRPQPSPFNTRNWLLVALLPLFLMLARPASVHAAGPPPGQWTQVNWDGFGNPATNDGTQLLTFGNTLLAWNEHGLFRMQSSLFRTWVKEYAPAPPANSDLVVLNGYLFLTSGTSAWFVAPGATLNSANWQPVTLTGVPGNATLGHMTAFAGQVYSVVNLPAQPFQIWRSPDLGKTAMTWQPVVSNAFGDPTNNQGVDFLAVFDNRIYAGTDTAKSFFGDVAKYGDGVEIWESPSGNSGSWTQVNIDGFGTQITYPDFSVTPPKMVTTRPNQFAWAWAVYKAPSDAKEYLYVGTSSHIGGEVWRYDGTGKTGWTNVTPLGPLGQVFGSGPLRNRAMAVYHDTLFVAEGYPTGNLWAYNGKVWSLVVSGPTPFDPQNGGLNDLAVHNDGLYASTLHLPFSGVTQGDQVWGYPFTPLYIINQPIPALPTSVFTPAGTQNSITLTWGGNASNLMFEVAHKGDDECADCWHYQTVPGSASPAGSWTHTDLQEGRAFEYWVRACVSGTVNCSGWAGPAKAQTCVAGPMAACGWMALPQPPAP